MIEAHQAQFVYDHRASGDAKMGMNRKWPQGRAFLFPLCPTLVAFLFAPGKQHGVECRQIRDIRHRNADVTANKTDAMFYTT